MLSVPISAISGMSVRVTSVALRTVVNVPNHMSDRSYIARLLPSGTGRFIFFAIHRGSRPGSRWLPARLSTAYARDVAFKFLHRVLPTRSRLARRHLASTGRCSVCGVPDETLEHVFDRSPLTHNVLHLFGSLFRSLSPNIPPTFTLLEAVFCRNLSCSQPLAALLWIVLVCIWMHRRDTSAHGMAGLIRHRFRERIRIARYECRRHRQPDYEYFSSQWMPPGITVPLVAISPNRTPIVFHF